MLYLFIDETNRSADVNWNSLKINDELQERINTASFRLNDGVRPNDYDEIFIYDGAEIVTVGSDFVTVIDLNSFREVFRVGDEIFVGLNTPDEASRTILDIDETLKKITFTTNLSGISAGEFIGLRMFGGNVLKSKDRNLHLLENLTFQISCVDFTKLFDKSEIIDTFEDRTPRYIINDNCNIFINFNETIDAFDYVDNAAIQVVWIEAGVGNNPLTDAVAPFEKDHWGSFASSASGTATWEATTLIPANVAAFTGVLSGSPIKGFLRMWIKHTDFTDITNYTFRIGSSNTDYIEVTKTPAQLGITSDDPTYIEIDFTDFSTTGTPDWTLNTYGLIRFVCTGSTTIKLAGMRAMELQHFAHFPFVLETEELETFNVNHLKPMSVIQTLARLVSFFWYIDYERRIHFFNQETNNAPFDLTDTSDNFEKFSLSVDTTNLKNVQRVEGGEDVASAITPQSFKGNDAIREFLLRTKFAGLSGKVDDSTTSNSAEAGTNTTNITITAHGLTTGDFITNRTRNDTVREVTVFDVDNLTVEAVTGQISGDTITFFDQARTFGIEGIVSESTVDYVFNSNARRIRASEQTATLTASEFIVFFYNERFPIITAAQDGTSIAAIKSTLGYTDGQFFGRIIRNRDIKSQAEAKLRAAAEVEKYGNAIFAASYQTHLAGIRSGEQQRITLSNRSLDQNFLIQKISWRVTGGQQFVAAVSASSVLYGIVEFFQQLLNATLLIAFDANAQPINLIQNSEIINIADTFEEKNRNTQPETITVTDNNSRLEPRTPPYKWGADANVLEWSLGEWG